MREIDHPHHAENDGQSDADQRQASNGLEGLKAKYNEQVHIGHSLLDRCGSFAPTDRTTRKLSDRSDLDDVHRVVVRVLLEIADARRVEWLLLREALQDVDLAVLDLTDVDVHDAVMRLRID